MSAVGSGRVSVHFMRLVPRITRLRFPVEAAGLAYVEEPRAQGRDEDYGRAISQPSELSCGHGPGEQKHGFDVEGEGGKLEVIFEEPEEVKFVISPNTPIREIWISALSTSFKLGWNESRNSFVLEKTGEDLRGVMSRVISQQLGEQVTV